MIQIYKSSSENNSSLTLLDNIETGCWINVVAPSDEELLLFSLCLSFSFLLSQYQYLKFHTKAF